jgi:predicted MPP superfamily phosphohydrolase
MEDATRFEAALAYVPEAMPRLMLSHNPDAAEDRDLLAIRPRIDLMISGHTHGGQVRFPVVGSMIVPSRYGQKYAMGLVKGPVCDVFVSRGIGTTILPIRFNVPPEIAVIELRAG